MVLILWNGMEVTQKKKHVSDNRTTIRDHLQKQKKRKNMTTKHICIICGLNNLGGILMYNTIAIIIIIIKYFFFLNPPKFLLDM